MINLILVYTLFSGFHELEREIDKNIQFSDRGELIANVGKLFIGSPYIANSLDKGDTETCVINIDGFDCVTFYENSIAISELIIKNKKINQENLVSEITNLRYKNGKINGYESRLHYSSDWILENTKRNKFEDITRGLGGLEFKPNLNFMSKNSRKYSRLKNKPKLVEKIEKMETEINKNSLFYIPSRYVTNIENDLKSGDIIFFKTDIKGLDYLHTGLISIENGEPLLLHASSAKNKVILDVKISEYLKNKKNIIGITILRPY